MMTENRNGHLTNRVNKWSFRCSWTSWLLVSIVLLVRFEIHTTAPVKKDSSTTSTTKKPAPASSRIPPAVKKGSAATSTTKKPAPASSRIPPVVKKGSPTTSTTKKPAPASSRIPPAVKKGSSATSTTKKPAQATSRIPLQISESEAVSYLRFYGYLDSTKKNVPHAEFTSALKGFQASVGIAKTGRLDSNTIAIMKRPRCGVGEKKDKTKHSTRSARYSFFNEDKPKWQTNSLTYSVDGSPLPETKQEIEKAFTYWSRESSLKFTYKAQGPVDIQIQFSAENSPYNDYGRPLGVLGYAFPPPWGEVFLDSTEEWTTGSASGLNLFQCAAHEIGHALGLGHSKDDASMMRANHPGNRKYLRTAPDDIRGIRSLYGSEAGRYIDETSTVYENYEDDRSFFCRILSIFC